MAAGKVIGWFQGRMEFGPRALGGAASSVTPEIRRSGGDEPENQIPGIIPAFAPSVLRENVSEYFEMDVDSPYMLLVAPVVQSRCLPIPAEANKLWGSIC